MKGLTRAVAIVIILLVLAAAIYWGIRDRGKPPIDAGAWNKDRAFVIAIDALKSTDWKSREGFCSTQTCEPVHQMYGDFVLTEAGREKRILATTSIEAGSDCHACGPEVSLFEFESGPEGWMLTDSDVGIVRWGQWGKLAAGELQVLSLGKSVYGVRLDGASTAQGVTVGDTSIYARINGDYHQVLMIQTSELDESSDTSWKSTVGLQPGTGEFLDILVERMGKREGLTFTERELFRFNGQAYEAVER